MYILKSTELKNSDLVVDKVYEGGRSGNASDDPLVPLVGVSNQGGFRYIGSKEKPKLIVLTSTQRDLDWPDTLDRESGLYTYYGDNKKPGHELHETPRFGNLLLRDCFQRTHLRKADRENVPPILIFSNLQGSYRDVQFLGLAVPGAENLDATQDLVAVWKLKDEKRFQNYRAIFTILNEQTISQKWLNDIKAGNPLSSSCPLSWRKWVEGRTYKALQSERTIEYRKKGEQLPQSKDDAELIKLIHRSFEENPYKFETCAVQIARLMLPNITSAFVTRPTKDGGRDAVGKYRIGENASAVLVDFALEAKCYGLDTPVGVKELSRLISRLRHRQFGVLVTTSYLAEQAYQEIKEDQHPVVIISAADIASLLKSAGLGRKEELTKWLEAFI